MEWVYKILVLVGVGVSAFFIGKYVYDKPLPPPEAYTVYQVDTVEVHTMHIDTVYERWVEFKKDTVYISNPMEEENIAGYYEYSFEAHSTLFRALITLKASFPIKRFIIGDPKVDWVYTDGYNIEIEKVYNNGYNYGYNDGYDIGTRDIGFKTKAVYGFGGLLVGALIGGIAF